MKQLTLQQKLIIMCCGMLMVSGPFSIDMYLPTLPTIQHGFHSNHAQIQLTLSAFFISYGMAQLVWGPLSDKIGRKVVGLIGMSVYVLSSLLCAISSNIEMLVISRFFQGIGACAGVVISLAITKDSFHEKKRLSKIISLIMSITLIAPAIAPIIGGYLLVNFGWRSNFYFLAVFGLVLALFICLLPESHPKKIRKPLPVNKLFNAYFKQEKNLNFLLNQIAVSCIFSMMLSFVAASPIIYISFYHLSPHLFGYYFAASALMLMAGSFSLHRLIPFLGEKNVYILAIACCFIGAFSMLYALLFYPHVIWDVVIPYLMISFGMGILFPATMALALNHVVAYTGLTSSLLGTSRSLLAALFTCIIGLVMTTSALPLAIVLLGLTCITSICLIIYFKINSV